MLLIRTVAMGDSSQMSNPTGWTKSDVLALLALLVGLPAAIVAVIVIPAVWKRHCHRRRGELSTFAISAIVYPRFCGLKSRRRKRMFEGAMDVLEEQPRGLMGQEDL